MSSDGGYGCECFKKGTIVGNPVDNVEMLKTGDMIFSMIVDKCIVMCG